MRYEGCSDLSCCALSLDAVVVVAILFRSICFSLSKHGDGVQALYYTIPFSPLYISLICGSLSFSLWSERLDHWIIFFRSSIDALLHHAQDYTNVAKTGEARRDSRSQSSCSRLKLGYYVFLSPRSEGIEEHFLSYTS